MCITYNMGPKCVCAKDELGQGQTKKKRRTHCFFVLPAYIMLGPVNTYFICPMSAWNG